MITGSSPPTHWNRRAWLVLAMGLLITFVVTLQVKSLTQTGGGFFSAPYLVVWLTMAGGVAISLLLFAFVRSLLNTHRQAETLARIMTRDLRKSEEKISAILNTVGEAVCGIDLNGCCTFCNPAALLILGYRSQEEMLGKNLHELAQHSFQDGSPFPVENCSIFKTITENRGYHVDNELFWRSDGSSFPVEYWSEPQLTEGRIIGAVVTFMDITEARERELKLQLSETKYRQLHESLRDAFVKTDLQGKFIASNVLFREMLGYSSEELANLTYVELTPPSWHAMEARLFEEQILGRGYSDVYLKEYITKSGGIVPVELRCFLLRDQNGQPEAMWAIIRDVTLRKELEAEIREAREYAENIVETIREPLLVLNSDLTVLSANRSFYDNFRVTPAETIGNFIFDLGSRQWDIPALRLLLENILPRETLFNDYEVEHDFPEIGRKTILLNARQICRNNIGSHIILLAMEDITRRKEILEELLLKDQALMRSEKMASIGQLAAGVAHEVNNPMAFISSNLRVLCDYFDQIVRFDRFRRDLDDSDSSSVNRDAVAARRVELKINFILDDGADLISGTLSGARRVTKIVQDLKLYTRLDALEKEMITLDHCLESALAICNSELKYVATIRKECAPLPEVICNQGQLNQVFLNLLVNAGQAITAPGEIVLRSWHDELFVYVSVSDTGRGIPEEIRNRIFDPFFTTKEVGKGTGLGLSISAEIMKKHNGELLMESIVGVGTTFTVKLPRTPNGLTVHPQEQP